MHWVRLGAADAAEEQRWLSPPRFILPSSFVSDSNEFLDGLRIVAGSTGSGKTRVLNVLRDVAGRDDVVVLLDHHALHTRTLEDLAKRDLVARQTESLRIEYWDNVWRSVLLSTLTTFADDISEALDEHNRLRLARLHTYSVSTTSRPLLPSSDSISLPYAQLAAIRHRSSDAAFFFDPRWNDIEADLAQILEKQKRLHVFMEAAEDIWEGAPRLALDCIHGLVRQLLHLTHTDHPLFTPLQVTVPVPDLVARTMHGRLSNRRTDRVTAISWTPHSLSELLQSRVALLPDQILLLPSAKRPIERISGLATIQHPERGGAVEPTDSYILRHCSRTPRDVINIANSLLIEAQIARINGANALDPQVIRERVGVEAHAIGTELLTQAATCLAAQSSESDTQSADMFDELVRWINLLPADQLPAVELKRAVEDWRFSSSRHRLLSTLWCCGILGRVTPGNEQNRVRFYEAHHDVPELSWGDIVAVHPSMVVVASLSPHERLLVI